MNGDYVRNHDTFSANKLQSTLMFITFEGPEGSGKTTQIPQIVQFLGEAGYTVFSTREPGGTSIGDQIRQVLLANKNTEMHPRSEILLFQASRAQLVEQEIQPRLERGEIVLCDRYADSTIAYQGYGHRVDLAQLRSIVDFATGGLKPDLTLLLDLDVADRPDTPPKRWGYQPVGCFRISIPPAGTGWISRIGRRRTRPMGDH